MCCVGVGVGVVAVVVLSSPLLLVCAFASCFRRFVFQQFRFVICDVI
jgi:hypothetical protein